MIIVKLHIHQSYKQNNNYFAYSQCLALYIIIYTKAPLHVRDVMTLAVIQIKSGIS